MGRAAACAIFAQTNAHRYLSIRIMKRNVCLSLPAEIVSRLDSAAVRFLRSRSNLARMILEEWLANPRTAPLARHVLSQIESAAHAQGETTTVSTSIRPSAAAHAEHLAEHARLSGARADSHHVRADAEESQQTETGQLDEPGTPRPPATPT